VLKLHEFVKYSSDSASLSFGSSSILIAELFAYRSPRDAELLSDDLILSDSHMRRAESARFEEGAKDSTNPERM
jgi:hypothetical protein